MKNKLNIVIIFLLLGLNSFLLYKYSRANKSNNFDSLQIHTSDEDPKMLRGRILLQSRYGASISIDKKTVCKDSTGRDVMLQQLIGKEQKLIYFFTRTHCNACIDETMPYLENLAKKVGYNRILVLADLEDPVDLKIYRNKYNSQLAFFKVQQKDLRTPAQDLGVPFMFIMDSDFNTSYFFIAERELPKVTEDYMSEMSLKLPDGL